MLRASRHFLPPSRPRLNGGIQLKSGKLPLIMSKVSLAKKSRSAQPSKALQEANTAAGRSFYLLKAATAKKIAKQADGGIGYEVLSDAGRHDLFIRITANDGGYFSRELVGVEKIRQCLSHLAKDATFPTKQLRPAFVGKSTCNAGFLVAVLRSEALVKPAPAVDAQHINAADEEWAAWMKTMLAEPGELLEIEQPASGAAPSAGDQAPSGTD